MNPNGSQEKIIKIDEGLVKRELGEIVRGTVEETLNKLLDAEADELCGAGSVNADFNLPVFADEKLPVSRP